MEMIKERYFRIKSLREDNDVKQKEMAKYLNVKENTYCQWEIEKNDIPIKEFNKIANYFHVTLDYLSGVSPNHKILKKDLDINLNTFTKRLRKLRKEHHYTQTFIGNKIGFPQTTYAGYENGIYTPTTYKIYLIATFYNVSMDYLLGRCDNPNIDTINTRIINRNKLTI